MSLPSSSPPGRRIRKRRRRRPRYRKFIALFILVAAGGAVLWLSKRGPSGAADLRGYISSSEILAQEFGRYTGKKLKKLEVVQNFDYATAMMRSGDYGGAVAQLEAAGKEAPVPVVFNNLGVLYARLG